MAQIFALHIDFGVVKLRQPFGIIQGRGASDKIAQIPVQFPLKFGIGFGFFVFRRQFVQRGNQGFRHKAPAMRPEPPVRVGNKRG